LSDKKALPVVVYLHGGGFITSTGAASIVYHGFCSNLASHLQAIVMSVEYRLAPERRLPAASDDAIEATHFIKKNSDEVWFKEHADYSSCYVMGKSAGGNIAKHAGLRVAHFDDFEPLKIKGLIHFTAQVLVGLLGESLNLYRSMMILLYH
jgi:acetyl esterase/lipase